MIAFDNRTAFVIIAMMYLLMPIFTWIVLESDRPRAASLWCGGGLLTGLGFLLVGLRGIVPDALAHGMANMGLLVGTLLRVQALRMDLGAGWRWRWLVLVAVLYLIAYEWIRLSLTDERERLVAVYLLYLVLSVLLVHLSLLARRISELEDSPAALWISRAYLLVVGAGGLRQWSVFSGSSGAVLLSPGWDTHLLAISLVLSSVVGHFGYVGIALDRSLRRERDVAVGLAREQVSWRLGRKVYHLDRQRSLGAMSATLAHELNQPLGAILANAQLAQRGLLTGRFDAARLDELLGSISASARRAKHIVQSTQDMLRPGVGRREPVELGALARDAIHLVAQRAQSRDIVFVLPAVLPVVRVLGDALQLSQVLVNVYHNAIEALSTVLRREIHVALQQRDASVVLQIRDTGPGISPELLGQVGTPFFTTKAAGLGVGLSISRSIAEQLGATFTIRNAEQGGALVELEFPVWRDKRLSQPGPSASS